jgi:hypothetical protein
MRFLEINEIWAWCAQHDIALEREVRPAADPSLPEKTRWLYADGERSGREPGIAHRVVEAIAPWTECLLWVTQVGVWPSSEDWPTYYRMRGDRGERRSIEVAPGHLFDGGETDLLVEFLAAAMESGWDAFVLPVGERPSHVRVQVSHDEWIEVQSARAVSINFAAV